VELTPLGEQRIEEGKLESLLRSSLGVDENYPIFIPVATLNKSGRPVTITLVEGYVFVGTALPEVKILDLEKKPYVKSVMHTVQGPHKMKTLHTVADAEIDKMRRKLRELLSQEIEVGTKMQVTAGRYRGVVGEVAWVTGDDAVLHFGLRSIEAWVTVPKVLLEEFTEATP
jgi:transcription antitermination factor NusG